MVFFYVPDIKMFLFFVFCLWSKRRKICCVHKKLGTLDECHSKRVFVDTANISERNA